MEKKNDGQSPLNDTSSGDDQSLVVSFLTIRKSVGVLGILLPVALALGSFLLLKCGSLEPSISHYYYTALGGYFVGTLCAVSLFLFCYKGYEKKDIIASKLASVFALGIAFCPTNPAPLCNIVNIESNSWLNDLHFVFSVLLFGTLAFISLALFTKGDGQPTTQKKKRNIVYKVCGYTMIACILLIAAFSLSVSLAVRFRQYVPIFILEAIALWAFGFSWLTKGEFLLKDK